MYSEGKIWIGKSSDENIYLYPKMANRHGMIAGATGTGKTVTLKVMAESFSDAGVPVFFADVKGDLSGMCSMGTDSESVMNRVINLGISDSFSFNKFPTNFWDVYQEKGIPLRTTVSEIGPQLLSQVLELNDIQSDILTVIYKIADDNDLLLEDTKDLKAMISYVGDNAKDFSLEYGNMSKQSMAAIIRSIVALEMAGAQMFFSETALDIRDWIRTTNDGRGYINILDCQKLINYPKMYSTFLLWMLSELYENLPEAGDMEKPRMVFFFDEAHMLFDTASKGLLEKITQIVKLIRSKGVGIYFVTQNPRDIPDEILAQLGNKVQHALRAYTPAELKAAKAAADSYRSNPEFDTYDTLVNLGIGEALISVLDEEGIPTMVKKACILPPQSKMGPISDQEREYLIKSSEMFVKYEKSIDNDSAYEFLKRKGIEEAEAEEKAKADALADKEAKRKASLEEKEDQKKKDSKNKAIKRATKNVASSTAGTVGRELGNALGSSVGGSFGKKLGGNIGASLGRGLIGTLFKL